MTRGNEHPQNCSCGLCRRARAPGEADVRLVVEEAATDGEAEVLDLRATQFGQTPIDEDAREFLTPQYADIETLDEMNEAEALNIADAVFWSEQQEWTLEGFLDHFTLRDLHRRMFCEVWTWAGTHRLRETNLGISPARVPDAWAGLIGNAKYWVETETYPVDEICVRLHHRSVAIHPFPNGNGRHARLMANTLAFILGLGRTRFTWGVQPGHEETGRREYLEALRAADAGDYTHLVEIATRHSNQ